MATPHERLAASLKALHALQARGAVGIRSADLSRADRERLLRHGFLKPVIKGWYIPARPDEPQGESTTWYAAFWRFCADYLDHRFGADWCLSPEQSLSLHAGNRTVPRQLLVRAPKARNRVTALPHGTSLLDVKAAMPEARDVEVLDGLRVYSLPAALVACAPDWFRRNATDARVALDLVGDASEVLERLLAGGHSVVAGRLAGAFRHVGRDRVADDIVAAMRAAGYRVREHDPFGPSGSPVLPPRGRSPWGSRIRILWQEMRQEIPERFPPPPGLPADADRYLQRVDDLYAADAYHSLSIEGYQVSPELVERVRRGRWRPDAAGTDRGIRDALAARGYWQAFRAVRKSLRKVLRGKDPGLVAEEDHTTWYRELFAPSVAAGLLRPTDLAGYRTGPVYIRNSMHVPPSPRAVRDAMPAFFELLREETDPAVRVVLGHFVFVYIHPYTDGNGRMARFLMNLMLAAGGWPWTVVPVEARADYMRSLEAASVRHDIRPFTDFLARLVTVLAAE